MQYNEEFMREYGIQELILRQLLNNSYKDLINLAIRGWSVHTNQRPAYTWPRWSNSLQHFFVVVWLPVCQSPTVPEPALKTNFGEQAFSHAGPAAWSSPSDYIQSESSTKLFKKLLKTYLFTLSFQFFNLFYRLSQHEMFACLSVDGP